ncbi:MAG: hypothetical protein HOC70_10535 [Gammaproteobacteria bacterium]|jgi:ubiquinone biosynthesis protein COQ4|nr:hypothetical protein [Gammaproteobacteria bacterium]MBT4493671.1 hypothetical protein [Gammaproteobacteria bacterium]MBT7371535.1 hypothetical protein [Gammaproteobacteria bacterium]
MNNKNVDRKRLRPLEALRALRRLIKDPKETDQVFVVIKAMSGNSIERAFEKFRETETGRRILTEQRQLLTCLQNRELLRSYPQQSLAAAYLHFVETGQLTADGLVDASAVDETVIEDPDLRLFAERMRDQHDLWHALTGYGMDPFGEVCLLAFTYAQTQNRGLGLITLVGMAKIATEMGAGVIKATWHSYRVGKKAAWLPAQDWETLLQQPLDEVRQQLGITPPLQYRQVLSFSLNGT